MAENQAKTELDLEIEKDIAKLREIIKRRELEALNDENDDICATRWVVVDDEKMEYYGFKQPKFCNTHWVNKTLFVVHRPTCKKPVACHCCGQLCVPQFLCIPCSGEINKYKWRKHKQY